ncbi:Gfo/Idh/MocA family oxidoreductase [Candidatus Marinimicrobia bacterium]|nr:Gfo/Idh/MocA family oxidoreductase [Candidatus Neomarinimicrobiota bacterium]
MIKMSSGTFNWGIIGTGGIANAFCDDISRLSNHRVSAVLSRSIENAKKFATDRKDCNPYDNNIAFVNDEKIDAVYVATPNTLHCQQSILAIQSKKPVLCEKPFAMNYDEAFSMISASKQYSTTLLDGMWMRYLPHIKTLKRLLSEEKIGNIESVYACHGQNLRCYPNPRLWTKNLGGGSLLDLGIYVISFSHMILGKPEKIFAESVFTEKNVDAKTSMIFQYANGAIANLSCSMYDTQPNRAVIAGTKGFIEIDPTFYAPTSIKLCTNEGEISIYKNEYEGHGLREQAIEMEYCVKNNLNESSKMLHRESLEVIEIMDKVRTEIGLSFK